MSKIIITIENGFDDEAHVSCSTKVMRELGESHRGVDAKQEIIQIIEQEVRAHLDLELDR